MNHEYIVPNGCIACKTYFLANVLGQQCVSSLGQGAQKKSKTSKRLCVAFHPYRLLWHNTTDGHRDLGCSRCCAPGHTITVTQNGKDKTRRVNLDCDWFGNTSTQYCNRPGFTGSCG